MVELLEQLDSHGCRGRAVSIGRLDDLRDQIESLRKDRVISETFFREHLAGFRFSPPKTLSGTRSLIVTALPDPQVRFSFGWKGRSLQAVIPPTYLHWQRKDKRIEDLLTGILKPEGYQVKQILLPKKLMAVCSGLAEYGKNNISYVPGMGSFHRLAVFCSDLPCSEDVWRQPKMMDRCQKCLACQQACPSGAISADRFLIQAERCIVLHNEEPSEVPFPSWLQPSWHNCLVGCLHCQRACPENKDRLAAMEQGAEFSEEETNLLLRDTPLEDLPDATLEKLRCWDLIDRLDILPRNLRVLLDNLDERKPREPAG